MRLVGDMGKGEVIKIVTSTHLCLGEAAEGKVRCEHGTAHLAVTRDWNGCTCAREHAVIGLSEIS